MEAIEKVIEILKKLGLSEELITKVQEELKANNPEDESTKVEVEVTKEESEEKMDEEKKEEEPKAEAEDSMSIEKRFQNAMPRL